MRHWVEACLQVTGVLVSILSKVEEGAGEGKQSLEHQAGHHAEKVSILRKKLQLLLLYASLLMFSFHALRDESFLRSTLQRQAATLHHATLGYAVS